MADHGQKNFLQEAKRRLRMRHPKLTWERLAELAEIEPRALKTYRMPEGSPDFRVMPKLVRAKIEELIQSASEPTSPQDSDLGVATPEVVHASFEEILLPALAALVLRQARIAIVDGRPVAGVDRYSGDDIGLTPEDRIAMALVSRARLRSGRSDIGAEIHELLSMCTQPLGDWLPLPSIHADRLSQVVLLDPQELMPTREADELARRFTSTTASIEELLFGRFQEQLAKNSRLVATASYTRVREFIVRHPVVTREELAGLSTDLPSAISVLIGHQFYEPIPDGWAQQGELLVCKHCRNAMNAIGPSIRCRTKACAETNAATVGARLQIQNCLRLTRGVRQYWQEPGFDEVRLFDALVAAGHKTTLYPHLDRVDLEVDNVGIDLKAYVSPELLAARIDRGIGGLAHYSKKWLVIPDRLLRRIPAYMERLRTSMRTTSVRVVAASAVVRELRLA